MAPMIPPWVENPFVKKPALWRRIVRWIHDRIYGKGPIVTVPPRVMNVAKDDSTLNVARADEDEDEIAH